MNADERELLILLGRDAARNLERAAIASRDGRETTDRLLDRAEAINKLVFRVELYQAVPESRPEGTDRA